MKYKVSKSKITNADKGLFAKKEIKQGERIGLAHRQGQPVGTLGKMHNHSDEPTMYSVKVGDKRYVYAKRDLKPGEELTTNYRMQPELEQPEDFMRKGGGTRSDIPVIEDAGSYNEEGFWIPNWESMKAQAKELNAKTVKTKHGSMIYFDDNWNVQSVDDNPQMKRGGYTRGLIPMPKPSKKGLASKKYSRSLDATNRLFTENRLFKKPKSKKNKVFDPNAKYYQEGGPPNFNIKPRLYTNSNRPGSQIIGANIDMSHKSGLHGNINAEVPFMNRNTAPRSTQDIGIRKKYRNIYGDATLSNYSEPGKLFNPSANLELGYEKKLGKNFVANAGIQNTMMPGSYFNPRVTAGIKYGFEDGGYVDLELDDDEIAQYVNGGYVVEDISVPSLNRFDNGGDTKPGVQNLPETTVYDGKSKKVQASLIRQLSDAKQAYQNFTEKNKGKKFRLNIADASSSIEDLRKGIQLYKDELRKEQEDTQAELKRLENLKSKAALKDNKDIQNLKLKDLNTTKGKMKILDAIRNSNLSGDQIAALYKGYGLDAVDPNVKQGKGSNAVYSAKEAEAAAMKDVPQFVDMVSKVATAIPLVGAAGAVGPAAQAVLGNPYVQGASTAYALQEVARHPMDTIEGVGTTLVEGYDLATGREGELNRFGEKYGQGLDELANLAIIAYPGLKTMKAARDWLKTKEGFNFAKTYIKPFKDKYKSAVKGFAKFTDPALKANLVKAAATPYAKGIDYITDSAQGTQLLNKAGQVMENMPDWAQPTVKNVLRGYTLTKAGENVYKGTGELQEGLSNGSREEFREGLTNMTDAVVDLTGVLSPANHAYNLTTPLNVIARSQEIYDDVSKDGVDAGTAFSVIRLINSMSGLPTKRADLVPINTKGFKGFNYLKPKHIRRHLKNANSELLTQQKGGIVTTMSNKEIQDYIKRGYIVEELD